MRLPSTGTVLGTVAVVFAMGGTAVAGSLVGSSGIKDNSIQSKDIKNNTVKGKDIKSGTIALSDLSSTTKKSLTGAQGPAGPAGAPGAPGTQGVQGVKGDTGPIGPSDTFTKRSDEHLVGISEASETVLTLTLPAGSYAFSASANLENTGAAGEFTCSIVVPIGNDFTETIGVARVTNEAGDIDALASTGATKIDAESTVTLRCRSESGGQFATVTDARLVATKVGVVN